MTNGKTFLDYDDEPAEWRDNKLLAEMRNQCSKGFPYVCAGQKWVRDDGLEVECGCGARMKV